MAITKRYVELMDGTISVDGEKGVGCYFTVELPMERIDEGSVHRQETPVIKVNLKNVHVLLSKDNDLNAEIATVQQEDLGMTVSRAVDGAEAVRLFSENPPDSFDIILTDIMMPSMNGYQATRTIRAMRNRPNAGIIPIIAMTANAFTEDIQKFLNSGRMPILQSPLSWTSL